MINLDSFYDGFFYFISITDEALFHDIWIISRLYKSLLMLL